MKARSEVDYEITWGEEGDGEKDGRQDNRQPYPEMELPLERVEDQPDSEANIQRRKEEADRINAIIHGILNPDEEEGDSEDLPWHDDSNIRGIA